MPRLRIKLKPKKTTSNPKKKLKIKLKPSKKGKPTRQMRKK